MDPGVRPLLHAEVVQRQVRVGEVDVVGAGAEDGRQDGHHRDDPDEQDDGANSCNLKNILGHHSACSKPPVDNDLKAVFYYMDRILKRNFQINVNRRF